MRASSITFLDPMSASPSRKVRIIIRIRIFGTALIAFDFSSFRHELPGRLLKREERGARAMVPMEQHMQEFHREPRRYVYKASPRRFESKGSLGKLTREIRV